MSLIAAAAIFFGFIFLGSLLFGPHTAHLAGLSYLGMFVSACVQIFAQGPYWQLIPLYLVVLFSPLYFLYRQSLFARTSLMVVGTAFLGITMACSFLLPLFHLPMPTGPHSTGTRILHFVDQKRPDLGGQLKSGHRELMVQAWYPIDRVQAHGPLERYRRRAEVTLLSSYMAIIRTHSFSNAPIAFSSQGYPVILFNPAWKGPRTECEYLMEDLASHGFVVFSIDHTYNSAPIAFPDGTRTLSASGPDIDDFTDRDFVDQQRQGDAEVRLQAQDNSFVLDELTLHKASDSDPWFKALNLDRVGVMGHSFGGATALQAAYSDARIISAINMDGWIFGDPAHIILRKPTMQMDEDIQWPTPEQLRQGDQALRIYWQFSKDNARFRRDSIIASGGYYLTIHGSRHMNFADRSLYSPIKSWTDSGAISPVQAHAIVSQYAYAFFANTLLNKSQALLGRERSNDQAVDFRAFPQRISNR